MSLWKVTLWKYSRTYFRDLLLAVPACNSFLGGFLACLHHKNFKFVCCLGGFHLQIILSLLKYVFFILSKTYPDSWVSLVVSRLKMESWSLNLHSCFRSSYWKAFCKKIADRILRDPWKGTYVKFIFVKSRARSVQLSVFYSFKEKF